MMVDVTSIPAIPTRYGGVQFRSRLEARWAAFFDLVGWRWEYEPLDLSGYIPDFVLGFDQPLLVEVKPLVGAPRSWLDEPADPVAVAAVADIERSGWSGEALLVGATLDQHKLNDGYVPSRADAIHGGLHLQWQEAGAGHRLSGVAFSFKACCGGPVNTLRWFGCLRCGRHDKGPTLREPAEVLGLWREAGNRVQWKAPNSTVVANETPAAFTIEASTEFRIDGFDEEFIHLRPSTHESPCAFCRRCAEPIGSDWRGMADPQSPGEFIHITCRVPGLH